MEHFKGNITVNIKRIIIIINFRKISVCIVNLVYSKECTGLDIAGVLDTAFIHTCSDTPRDAGIKTTDVNIFT